jgi:hypothetical protein
MATAPSPTQIDIRIGRVDQRFQTFDPSRFRERDLDPDATAFIVDWARELNRRVPLEIHLNVKDSGPALSLIAESLTILGWVVNWRPLEIFLYEWRPIRRDAKLFRRLAAARIKVQG